MEEIFTYREDEILIIFKECNSLQELKKTRKLLGYLNRHGVQAHRPVISKIYNMREKQLSQNIGYGRNNKN